MAPLDVAIVGCGVPGMAAAVFLSRGGHRVHLFERFAAPQPLGSGLQSDWRLAAAFRDIAFPAIHAVPYFRRETTRALAGLRTGLFTSARPDKIEGFEP